MDAAQRNDTLAPSLQGYRWLHRFCRDGILGPSVINC